MSECCITGFNWNGSPSGKEDTIGGLKTYVAGSNSNVAVVILHDIFGWTFKNTRILADHFAKEADATVYIPDLFGGEVVTPEMLEDSDKQKTFDFQGFFTRNGKHVREPEITKMMEEVRSKYKRVAAIGYCYGAWACFRVGAKGKNFVDCISMAHPSLLEKTEIDNVAVPVQIMAPETDPQFTPELKEYANKVIPTLNVDYDYQYFPGLVHGFAIKGDQNNKEQKAGLERAKNSAIQWFRQYLHLH